MCVEENMTTPSCKKYHTCRRVPPANRSTTRSSPMAWLSSWPVMGSVYPLSLPKQFRHCKAPNVVYAASIISMTPSSCKKYHAGRRIPLSNHRTPTSSPMVWLSSCIRWGPYIPSGYLNNSAIAWLRTSSMQQA